MTAILSLGEPNKDNYTELVKSGCALKKKETSVEATIEEIPIIIDYNQSTGEAGSAIEEATTKANAAPQGFFAEFVSKITNLFNKK